MKLYLPIIGLILFSHTAFARHDSLTINGVEFLMAKKAIKTMYGRPDTVLKIYRIENGKAKYLLSHYLFRYGKDCNNEYKDVGRYRVEGNRIIFTTSYFQKGFDPIAKWSRQVYEIKTGGKLVRLSDYTKY